MRAFLAIPIPPEIQRRLHGAAEKVEGLRAQRAETIHLTLRFLGEIEDADSVVAAITPVAARTPSFDLEVRGLGVFPHPRAGRVLWAGVAGGAETAESLAREVEEAVCALGIAPESRAWRAHVTLGRFRHPARLPQGFLDADWEFGRLTVREIVLFRSTLTPNGAVHEAIREMSLLAGR